MPNLENLIRWQRYEPDLGSNRAEKRPFYVELAVGLTKQDLERLADAMKSPERAEDAPELTPDEAAAEQKASIERLAAGLEPFVRIGKEPLRVNGESIDTLLKLLELYARVAGGDTRLLEIALALRWFNSAGGGVQLFYERLSGGSGSTTQGARAAR